MNYQQTVIIKTQLEALHQWQSIPNEHPSHYLKNLHRHVFHIELRMHVDHADRDIEFIAFKQIVDQFLSKQFMRCELSNLFVLENVSCEMLALRILKKFQADGCYWVQVLEDGDMGAIAEISK